jgi:hypothetical protein
MKEQRTTLHTDAAETPKSDLKKMRLDTVQMAARDAHGFVEYFSVR